MTGTIAKLEDGQYGDDGYGFILGADRLRYYFNPSGLQLSSLPMAALQEGMPCSFTPISHPKGPRAIEVRVVDPRQGSLI